MVESSGPNRRVVAMIGKIGHGKTHLLNKITGQRFPSHMGSRSVTREVQYGYGKTSGVLAVDTPGFYASDNIASHIAAQKVALEEIPLSGIFVVAKYDRADAIAESVNKIMWFTGTDDVRLILSHGDTVENQEGYDPDGTKRRLKDLLGIEHVLISGKNTPGRVVEAFITQTLHEPTKFKITDAQMAMVASLCVASRKMNRVIDEVYAKIESASLACRELVQRGKSLKSDEFIVKSQTVTEDMVRSSKVSIFRQAEEYDSDEQKNLIYGRAGLALSLRLKNFMDATNKCLTWDVTDTSDQRNDYRQCPYCCAIFNKTEGCNGQTTCGAVPESKTYAKTICGAEFRNDARGWSMWYAWKGNWYRSTAMANNFSTYELQALPKRDNAAQKKEVLLGGVIESGCGATISWDQMRPIDESLIKALGEVEIKDSGTREERASARAFWGQVTGSEVSNKDILQEAAWSP